MALLIQRKAAKELASVPREEWQRLRERLENIAQNPRARHPGVELLTMSRSFTCATDGRSTGHHDRQGRDREGPNPTAQ